jgi:hypothetical protein
MSFDTQSSPNETRSLCVRKREKKEKYFHKNNSLRLLLLADSLFAIDVQHDKRRSLEGRHPSCSEPVVQGASLATCFC